MNVIRKATSILLAVCMEGGDPYPGVPKEFKPGLVRLYGAASFDKHVLGR
jgi:hypothetical protein